MPSTSKRIAIIPGHGWRGPGRFDPGAVGQGLREADIVRELARYVVEYHPEGARIFDSPEGGPHTYTARRDAAQAWIAEGPTKEGIVPHLHTNAGSSTAAYSMAMYDPRSTAGRKSAERLSLALASASVSDVRPVAAVRPNWSHAANLIEPTFAAPAGVHAVLIELGFISNPACARLYTADTLRRVARAIVAACG